MSIPYEEREREREWEEKTNKTNTVYVCVWRYRKEFRECLKFPASQHEPWRRRLRLVWSMPGPRHGWKGNQKWFVIIIIIIKIIIITHFLHVLKIVCFSFFFYLFWMKRFLHNQRNQNSVMFESKSNRNFSFFKSIFWGEGGPGVCIWELTHLTSELITTYILLHPPGDSSLFTFPLLL